MNRTRCLRFSLVTLVSACATVVPMQPASVLPEGQLRIGGQMTLSPLCGFSRNFAQDCAVGDNGLNLPELRFNARRGMGKQSDIGFSLQGLGAIQSPRPLQLGLTLDGKHELFSRSLGNGRRQILSGNFALHSAFAIGDGKPGSRTRFELDAAIPLQFGHQTERFEWVVSVRYLHRFRFTDLGSPLAPPVSDAAWFQVALGLFRRSPGSWGVQVGYLAPAAQWSAGALQIGYSLDFDVSTAPMKQDILVSHVN